MTATPSRSIIRRASLAHMLGTKEDADTVEQALAGFSAFAQPTLGAVEVVRDDERFCIYVPAEGAEYVHEKVPDSGFLKAFLAVVSGLEVSLDDILAVFHRFSDEVVCEKIEGSDEFDYLVYFKNGEPDGYRLLHQARRGRLCDLPPLHSRGLRGVRLLMDQKTIVLCIAGGAVALVLLSLAGADSAHGSRHASCAMPIRRVRCFPRTSGRRTGR